MKKKILVVSPTPTHPAIAGNRKRIFTMLKTLQAMGGEVTLVLDDQEGSGGHTSSPTDYQGMRAEWDAFYRVQDFGFPAAGEAPVTLRIFRAAGSFLRGHLHFLYELAAPLWLSLRMRIHREIDSGGVLDRRTGSIDRRYNPNLTRVLSALCREGDFDAMLVEYVFMSRALLGFSGPLGVIDTHDVFSGRTEKLKERKVRNTFFSTSSEEEGKGLDRADVILAIQDEEAGFLEGITASRVVTVGHLTPYIGNGEYRGEGRSLLFVGAGNTENIEGLNDFVDSVFTPLVGEHPGYRLFVAGNVGAHLHRSMDEITCLGEIDDLADAYRLADLTVSPVNVGTGLKIKIIESMAYGIPVIGTSYSLTGVPEIFRECCLAVGNRQEFRNALASLLEDPARLRRMHRSCRNAVEEYQRINEHNLRRVFFADEP